MSALAAANRRISPRARSAGVVLGAILALACLVRFGTLGAKSLWTDEGSTVVELRRSFGAMLHLVNKVEDTPPLYFVLAWLWSQVFGLGEVGLRALSALSGVLTVPVAFLTARRLVGRRAALVTAALVAVNPLLVWYSQEARSYALLLLLGALSLQFCVTAVQTGGTRWVAAWALTSVAVLYTQYVGFALVAAEGAWLLWHRPTRWRAAGALAAVAVCAAPLVPTLRTRAADGRTGWIAQMPYGNRLVGIPKDFLVGFEGPAGRLLAMIAGLLVVVGLVLLARRGTASELRGARIAAVLGAAVLAFPLLTGLLGHDLLLYRYVLLAVVPAAIVVAAGLGARGAGRLGAAATVALCAVSLVVLGLTAWTPKYGTEDWRAVAAALRPLPAGSAILLEPKNGRSALAAYLGPLRPMRGAVGAREIALVELLRRRLDGTIPPAPRRPAGADALARAGFRLVSTVRHESFTVSRYRARAGAVATVGSDALIPPGASGQRVLLALVGARQP